MAVKRGGPVESSKVSATPDGVVSYAGKPIGRVTDTGRRYDGGRGVMWASARTGELHYSLKAAAMDEARAWMEEGRSKKE